MVYSHSGGGQTIVLLHGFLEERGMWRRYSEVLASAYSVIAVDLLGQGESGNLGYVHTMEDQARAVLSVLEAEQISRCMIIGHSMGGYVALAMANLQPDLISALVLFHSTAIPDSDDRRADRERVIDLVQRNKLIYLKAAIPSLFAESSRVPLSAEINELIETANGFSTQGIIANIRGMMERKDRTNVLKNKAFRQMVIHGEFDSVISKKDITAQVGFNDSIVFHVVSGIGHMGHLEAPDECLSLLTEFCKN